MLLTSLTSTKERRRFFRMDSISLWDKQCTFCGQVKDIEEFSPGYGGVRNQCKACAREYAHQRYQPRVKPEVVISDTKTCYKCHQVLPLEAFSKDKGKKDGYHGKCRECHKAYVKALYNPSPRKPQPAFQCQHCHEIKSPSDFTKNKSRPNGYDNYCRKCRSDASYKYKHGVEKPQPIEAPEIPDGHKQCAHCSEIKPFNRFSIRSDTRCGYASWCKDCHAKRPKYLNNARLIKNYGITAEQYETMLEEQNGVCASCHNHEMALDPRTGNLFGLSVDHDHETGHVRGLLCMTCNRCLGLLHDDPERIKELLRYLEKWKGVG